MPDTATGVVAQLASAQVSQLLSYPEVESSSLSHPNQFFAPSQLFQLQWFNKATDTRDLLQSFFLFFSRIQTGQKARCCFTKNFLLFWGKTYSPSVHPLVSLCSMMIVSYCTILGGLDGLLGFRYNCHLQMILYSLLKVLSIETQSLDF